MIWGVLGLVATGFVTLIAYSLIESLFEAMFPAQHQWLSSYRGAAAAQGFMSAVCVALGLVSLFAPGSLWPPLQADGDAVMGGLFILAAVFFFVLLVHTIRQARIASNR